jgi:hypothetical protein
MRKNVVAIDNVLWEKTIMFSLIQSTKIILEIIIKKNYLEKYCSNIQCFVRKTTTFSPYDLVLL